MIIRIAIGAVAGLLVGGVLGYVGRCRSGACPMTSSPFMGGLIGLVLGAALAYSLVAPAGAEGSTLAASVSTQDQFDKQVLQADKPVLVDFFATWCGPCKIQAPILEAIEKEYAGKATVVKVDIDQAAKLAGQYRVEAVPTVMLFNQGKAVKTWVGVTQADALRKALNQQIPTKGKESMTMATQVRTVNFKGNPLTLLGQPAKVGGKAPDFTAIANDLKEVHLSDYKGKVVVLAAVPSLDTKVCDLETRRFNEEAAKLDKDIVILTVSMDLPFAQARWCGAAGVEQVKTLSDHREASFGLAYGVLIKELRLLARSVFVVDRQGTIVYEQIVDEVTHEPNYQAALDAAKKAV